MYARVEAWPGWLTPAQGRVLWSAAAAVPAGGTVVEIGSHHGRSTVVLASALAPDARVVAVDPFPSDWRYGSDDTERAFRSNLADSGVSSQVEVRVATSRQTRQHWSGPVHLVYVDGKHDYWTCRDDLRWADHVVPGGALLVHDAYSSLGVTTALLRTLVTSRSLRYRGRTGSLAVLEVRPPTGRDRLRVLAPLPWWGRNLVVKVLLRLRLRFLARALGHTGSADPY